MVGDVHGFMALEYTTDASAILGGRKRPVEQVNLYFLGYRLAGWMHKKLGLWSEVFEGPWSGCPRKWLLSL